MNSQSLTPQELDRLRGMQSSLAELHGVASDSPLLQQLASIDRKLWETLTTERRYAPGEFVFREGEAGDAMYLIWSGRVVVVKGDLECPTILGYRGPGQIVGEMAILENRPRVASIIAVEESRLLRIGREGFQELLQNAPIIGMSIMGMLSARLRESSIMRQVNNQAGRQLMRQVTELQTEKQQLLELQRVRQETSDLIIHDLRNPLGVINGAISMLRMVLPVETLGDNRELLDMAESAAGRMQRLVESLLDVAAMEAGEVQMNFAPVRLQSLAAAVGNRTALQMRMSGITFCADVPEDVPPVQADEEKIDRVLTNLMDNAIKYTPNEGRITLAGRVEGEQVVVSVTDTGPGIPPQERERIFERFAQVAGDKPRRRGFGLGLTFCKLTVQAHGGRIWVEAGDGGVGSRFAFTLPVAEAA